MREGTERSLLGSIYIYFCMLWLIWTLQQPQDDPTAARKRIALFHSSHFQKKDLTTVSQVLSFKGQGYNYGP